MRSDARDSSAADEPVLDLPGLRPAVASARPPLRSDATMLVLLKPPARRQS
jgi:hypothetical protein